MPPKPKGRLTLFLVDLAKDPALLARFQDDGRREALLEERQLKGNKALRKGATLAEVKAAVAAENDGNDKVIDIWILVGQAPIKDQ